MLGGKPMKSFAVSAFSAALLLGGATYGKAQAQQTEEVSQDVISLQTAIEAAMRANPEILQAQYNAEGIQFERRQAQGLFGPRVDVEASACLLYTSPSPRDS